MDKNYGNFNSQRGVSSSGFDQSRRPIVPILNIESQHHRSTSQLRGQNYDVNSRRSKSPINRYQP